MSEIYKLWYILWVFKQINSFEVFGRELELEFERLKKGWTLFLHNFEYFFDITSLEILFELRILLLVLSSCICSRPKKNNRSYTPLLVSTTFLKPPLTRTHPPLSRLSIIQAGGFSFYKRNWFKNKCKRT